MAHQTPSKAPMPPQYGLAEFTERHKISSARAIEILRRAGDNREEADLAVLRYRQAASLIEA
jgi:hypothetical protein